MDKNSIRVDAPAPRLSYPNERDKKGYARLSLKGKRYHFGRFGTPESYAAFALWSAELARSGEAPEVASIKPLVQEFLAGQPSSQPMYTKKWFAAALILAAATLGLCGILASQIASRMSPPQVDGIAMSEGEILRIRNTRLYDQRRVARRATPEAIATRAFLLESLKEHGSASLPLPEVPAAMRRLAKPPLPAVSSGDADRRVPGNDSATSGGGEDQ